MAQRSDLVGWSSGCWAGGGVGWGGHTVSVACVSTVRESFLWLKRMEERNAFKFHSCSGGNGRSPEVRMME